MVIARTKVSEEVNNRLVQELELFDKYSVSFLPNNFGSTRSFAGRRGSDLPVRRDLVFDLDLLSSLTGEILARRHVGLATDVPAKADSAPTEINFAESKTI